MNCKGSGTREHEKLSHHQASGVQFLCTNHLTRAEAAHGYGRVQFHSFFHMDQHTTNSLNSIRLIAALMVLFSHCWPLTGIPEEPLASLTLQRANLGFMAVQIFFAISGYLIAQSAATTPSLHYFIRARFLRIFPGLWGCLLITLAMTSAVSALSLKEFLASPETHNYLWHNAILDTVYTLPGVFQGNPTPASVNGSLWTLPVEMACYLIMGFCVVTGIVARREVFAAMCVVCVVLWLKEPQGLLPVFPDTWPSPFYAYDILAFVVGALLYLYREKVPLRFATACALWLLVLVLFKSARFNFALCIALAYSVLWLGVFIKRDPLNFVRRHDISYGVYLYAFPLQQLLVMNPAFNQRPLLLAAASVPLVLLMGLLSWRLIEKPVLRFKGNR